MCKQLQNRMFGQFLKSQILQFVAKIVKILISIFERIMYVTRQILNGKHKKLMLPHNRQIFNQIKASIDDEQYQRKRNQSFQNIKSLNRSSKRPQTANNTNMKYRTFTQQRQNRSNSFTKKINFKIDEIKSLSNLFGKVFDYKKKKGNSQSKNLPQKVKQIKNRISQKQNEQIKKSRKIYFSNQNSKLKNQQNLYMGYPKQKMKKTIPTSSAKDADINLVARCIKGGYIDSNEEWSNYVCKSQLMKLRKKFITFDTLYTCVKGKKNKGIREIKPEQIDRNSLVNLVYYMQNEKNLKLGEKLAIQQKMNFIQ